MKHKLIAALGLLFLGLIALTALTPRLMREVPSEPTPTPTHNLLLGTQSPEDANSGFPSPVPTLPLPIDLDPARPLEEKELLVFYAPEGEGFVAFLVPYEKIEELVNQIGVDRLVGLYPSSDLLPLGPDEELPALQTAAPPATPPLAEP